MTRISLKEFNKEEKEIIKSHAKVLKEKIEKSFPIKANEKLLKKMSKDIAFRAYYKCAEGYISYEEITGSPKIIFIKQDGYQWPTWKDKPQQRIVVVYNDIVAMLYDVEDECVANTQAIRDWTNEDRILIYAETK